MSFTYPLSLPSAPAPVSLNATLVHAQAVSESPFTFEDQLVNWGGQRWLFTVTLPPMLRATAENWIAFRLKLEGAIGTFLMGDPACKTPRGSWPGAPVVDGAGQTGNTLNIKGLTPSQTNICVVGDYGQLGTALTARLYKNLSTVNSDASGKATLSLKPAIISAPADGAALITTSARGLFKMADAKVDWNVSLLKYGISFDCMSIP